MEVPRFDKRDAHDINQATSRFELEQTWNGGSEAVQRAIDAGIIVSFRGPGGHEYCKKRVLEWGRHQGVETKAGIQKAYVASTKYNKA